MVAPRLVFCLVFVLFLEDVSFSSSRMTRKNPNTEQRKELAVRQNEQAEADGLKSITEKDLQDLVRNGALVSLPDNFIIRTDPRLEEKYRYCRPWVLSFLLDLGEAYYFKAIEAGPIQINSAVRTVERQSFLLERRVGRKVNLEYNQNAAPITGPRRSSHLTGSTVDLSKWSGDADWLRDYLWQKFEKGEIIFVEEMSQAVFHVMVPKNYGMKRTIGAQ